MSQDQFVVFVILLIFLLVVPKGPSQRYRSGTIIVNKKPSGLRPKGSPPAQSK